jgi:invasion protein IalB
VEEETIVRVHLTAVAGLVGLSLSAASAFAGEQTPTPTAAPAAADAKKYDPDKVVCKTEEVSGTRLGSKRVCRTVREWEQIARDAQDATLDTQLRSKQSNPGPQG